MVALLVGIVFAAFAVFAVIPFDWALQWGPEVVVFLKGGAPIFAALIAFISILIGIADLKDKAEARREEAEEAAGAGEAGEKP